MLQRPLHIHLFQAALIAVILTLASYAVGLISKEVNWFEIGATALNYASFYLSVKQRRAFYLVGVAGSALFTVVYLQSNLLASGALSAYLSIALLVGYFLWGRDSDPLRVERIKAKWLPVYIVLTVAAYIGAAAIVYSLGGSFAFWDSAILVFTLLAQFMMDRKKIEHWWVWIIGVNGAGTVLYATSGLYLIAVQQFLFGLASVWGWLEWRKTMREESADG